MNVTNNVRTNFTGNAANFVNAAKTASSAASGMVGAVKGVFNQLTGLPGLLAGVAGGFGISEIIAVNSEFTNAQRTIGGTFAALGMASDFNSGLRMAADTMETIERDAAALPGEASDYINVFQTALPAMNAVRSTLEASGQSVAQFSNRFAAVANTFGVEMVQAGSDLSRMLAAGRGQIEMMSPTWMRLMPFIKSTAQEMHLTVNSAADFNRLTEQQRALLLQNTVNQGGLNGMLEQAGHSWDSQFGTLQAFGKSLLRQSSAPLYENLVSSLESANGWMEANKESMIAFGRMLSTQVVTGFRVAAGMAQQLFGFVQSIGSALAASGVVDVLMGAGANLADGAAGIGAQLTAMTATGGAFDPAAISEMLIGVVEPLSETLSRFSEFVGPFVGAVLEFGGAIASITMTALPYLASSINAILTPMLQFWTALSGIVTTLLQNVRPTFVMLTQKIGGLVQSIANMLHPAMRLVGAAFTWIADELGHYLAPAIQMVGDFLGSLVGALTSLITWIGDLIGKAANELLGPETTRRATSSSAPQRNAANALNEAAQAAENAAQAQQQASRPTPSGRGGGGTHQDFRGSRFEITQKFAEQFDPDRIAVAFASDLGRIGEYRLQSGLAPLYALR